MKQEKHVDIFVGATVKVGPNLVTYLTNHKGKQTLRIVGPDAVSASLVGDAKPKRRQTGRLIDKRPRVLSLDIRSQSIERVASSA